METERSITLHPALGVNPRMTFCRRCGNDGAELLLLGKNNQVFTCAACGVASYGARRCLSCLSRKGTTRELESSERLPSASLCDTCAREKNEFVELVKAGGVWWRCSACKADGVIKSNPLTASIRETLACPIPEECGVEFSADDCPACGPNKDKRD